eukprot:TRINITY_DN5660_c0_g1_i2.p1 TRINITY_DN5660_c0_g1~~TRINITY_DN5660_c0_g1_i2.p1  ORF type:complete len:470 (-),score=104.57 TRINITY_DN5660_c0_g1_i2:275-1684(-)
MSVLEADTERPDGDNQDELLSQLEEYAEQLTTVDDVLRLDPTNEEFIALHAQLFEVVQTLRSALMGDDDVTNGDGLTETAAVPPSHDMFGDSLAPLAAINEREPAVAELGADEQKFELIAFVRGATLDRDRHYILDVRAEAKLHDLTGMSTDTQVSTEANDHTGNSSDSNASASVSVRRIGSNASVSVRRASGESTDTKVPEMYDPFGVEEGIDATPRTPSASSPSITPTGEQGNSGNEDCTLNGSPLPVWQVHEIADWEQHTRGFGRKVLTKLGYRLGNGIGKNNDGIALPIGLDLRATTMRQNRGVGHEDREKAPQTGKKKKKKKKRKKGGGRPETESRDLFDFINNHTLSEHNHSDKMADQSNILHHKVKRRKTNLTGGTSDERDEKAHRIVLVESKEKLKSLFTKLNKLEASAARRVSDSDRRFVAGVHRTIEKVKEEIARERGHERSIEDSLRKKNAKKQLLKF